MQSDLLIDSLKGASNGSTIDLSFGQWTYQPTYPKDTPQTWYKTTFSAPSGNSPVAIDFTGMAIKWKPPVAVGGKGRSNHLTHETRPTLLLECPPPSQVMSKFHFISFGNPHGTCGSFGHGRCSTKDAQIIVEKFLYFSGMFACTGKPKCSVEVSVNKFGDPCTNVTKSLAVEASCS
ncbi:Beta-galactosidase [Handroanthus impetiginosus]|uniref:Beta-galactosidase n=1 Tax=Handroanthus impetiginosus TaxID=429701 RepID=A0A2G9H956_9LAMI|nr:Beta-galactosidase [Handroanthus impetiginosus]